MDKLELYKFAQENISEWHWEDWDDNSLTVFVSKYAILDLCKLLGYNYWDDGYGYEHTHLCPDGDISIDHFNDWCEDNDIDPKEIFNEKGYWEE